MVHRTQHRTRRSAAALGLALLLVACGSAQAVSKTRVLGASFFALGLSLKLGGAVVGGGAAETYDDYLLTADQAALSALGDDYDRGRRLGQGLSGTGNGFLAAGVHFATFPAAFRTICWHRVLSLGLLGLPIRHGDAPLVAFFQHVLWCHPKGRCH